jgi:Spy/CpxP family protein refolding chaperone
MTTWFFIIGLLTVAPVFAQHDAHQNLRRVTPVHPQAQPGHAPYAGMQSRAIMALSDQQVADLRAGRGMSLALPAELNGYPGPSHALELANALALTAGQKLKTQTLLEQMQAEAKALGEQLISSEYELDRLFKDKKASSASVQEATAKAARVQGQLRASHLQYHLKMVDVLTPDQVAKYNELRGYR